MKLLVRIAFAFRERSFQSSRCLHRVSDMCCCKSNLAFESSSNSSTQIEFVIEQDSWIGREKDNYIHLRACIARFGKNPPLCNNVEILGQPRPKQGSPILLFLISRRARVLRRALLNP